MPRPHKLPSGALFNPFGEDSPTAPLNFEFVSVGLGFRGMRLAFGKSLAPSDATVVHQAQPNKVLHLLRVPSRVVEHGVVSF
jgi:hypothetical protein